MRLTAPASAECATPDRADQNSGRSAAPRLFNLIIILIIGAVAGPAFNRYARSWIARLGSTRCSDVTSALVGIVIGFHHQRHSGLSPSRLMHYVWPRSAG
jgi:hypothetical protein